MPKTPMLKTTEDDGGEASSRIDARIAELGGWRGGTLARVRDVIRQADPEVVETWKWRGVPVWEHAGILCTGETYRDKVKLTFARGAALADPSGLFNASLDRQHPARHRPFRGRHDRRSGADGAGACRRGPEHRAAEVRSGPFFGGSGRGLPCHPVNLTNRF